MPRKRTRKRDYSSGTVYKNSPTSKTWTVSWRENGQREREGGFGSKDEGQQWLDKVVIPNIRAGKPGRPAAAQLVGTNTLSVVVEKWFAQRKLVSAQTERYNWKNHLEPEFGNLMPAQLDSIRLAQWCNERLPESSEVEEYEGEEGAEGEGQLAPATIKNIVAFVSTLYTDLIDTQVVTHNPAKSLPTSVKRRLKSDHDPATTPFVRHLSTVFAIIRTLPEPFSVAYAVGALAGLRTGEVLGLDWESIDLDPSQRKITVRQQVSRNRLRRPKSKKARTVLIVDALYPILIDWHRRTGGVGLLFRPLLQGWSTYLSPGSETKWTAQWTLGNGSRRYHGGFESQTEAEAFARVQQAAQPPLEATRGGNGQSRPKYMSPKTLHKYLDRALTKLGLQRLTWYQSTRHTFASQWVLARGDMKLLQKLLGHHSITTTERYARLDPDHFDEDDYRRLAVDAGSPPSPTTMPAVTAMAVSPGAIEAYVHSSDAELTS